MYFQVTILLIFLVCLLGSITQAFKGPWSPCYRMIRLFSDQHETTFPANPQKRIAQDVILNEAEIEEAFTKGSGKGGQKINKTMNRVVLTHKPTGIRVSCQEVRDLDTNRKLAREMLVEKLDVFYNQELSKLKMDQQRQRKRKQDARRKSKKKYAKLESRRESALDGESEEVDDFDDGDDVDSLKTRQSDSL